MNSFIGFVIAFEIIVALMGLFLAVTPWLMKKQECFTVTVPESARHDARLRAYQHRYAAFMAGITLFACVFMAVGFFFDKGQGSWMLVGINVGVFVPVLSSFLLMLHYRKKVIFLKKKEGWVAQREEVSAVISEQDLPCAISLKWNLLYLVVIVLTAGIGIAGYPLMPDLIPMHSDLAGNVTSYEPKSPGVVAFPILVQLFMVACFVFCHWTILRSKRAVDSQRPVTSALAYGLFARAQSIFLLVTGLLVSGLIGITFMLSALGWMSLGMAAVCIVVVVLILVVGSVALSVVYGQSGSRILRRLEDSTEMPSDNDAYWKLGIFYCNVEDSSIVVPERFGIGWTFNWARPTTWILVGAFAVLTVLFIMGVLILLG